MVCYEDRWRQKHAVGYVTSWRERALGDSDSERAMRRRVSWIEWQSMVE